MAVPGNWDFGAAFKFGFTGLKKCWLVLLITEILFIILEFFTAGGCGLSSPVLQVWFGIQLVPAFIPEYDPRRKRSDKLRLAGLIAILYTLITFSGLLFCIVGIVLTYSLTGVAMGFYYEHREQGVFGALKAVWRRIFSDGQWKIIGYVWALELLSGLVDLGTLGILTPVLMFMTAAWNAAIYCQAFPLEERENAAA